MLKVMTDVRFSRRKRIHYVLDERDQLQWSGPVVDAALHYCWEQGERTIRIEGTHFAFDAYLSPIEK